MKTFTQFLNEGNRGVIKYTKADLDRDIKEQEKALSPEKKKVLAFFKKYSASGTGQGKGLYHFEFLPYSEGKLDLGLGLGLKQYDSFIQLRFKGNEVDVAKKFYKKYWREGEMWELWEMGGSSSKKTGLSNTGRNYVVYDKNGDGKGMES